MALDLTLAGRRVRLESTTDPYTALRPGALGTINYVRNDTTSIKWDSGSNLSMIDGEDRFTVLPA